MVKRTGESTLGKHSYYISKVSTRAVIIFVNLAGRTLLHGPLKLKFFLVAKRLRDLSPNFLNL